MDRDTSEEAELIARLWQRASDAIEPLYERHGRAVLLQAQRIVRDIDLAQEVVQETFFQAWRDAATYDPVRGPLRAWLLVIARARALDRLRSRKARDTRLSEFRRSESFETIRGAAEQPDYQKVSGRCELAALLRILPEGDRLLVSLAHEQGLSHCDIAAHTGLPLGTIKTRLRRVLALLRCGIASDARPFAWRPTAVSSAPTTAPEGALAAVNIVAVDDEPDTLRLTTLVLERAGAKVIAVLSAAQALRVLRVRLPDILVTDIQMPNEDGYDLLTRLRQMTDRGAARLPAVAFTAHGSTAEVTRARRAGFAAVLGKPVRPPVLVAQLAELVVTEACVSDRGSAPHRRAPSQRRQKACPDT